jgi:DNA-binding transcriptional regulator PaaX
MPRDETGASEGSIDAPRPQQLVLAFVGELVVDRYEQVPARVFLDLLRSAGVRAASARATLARMVRRGLLERVKSGRTVDFSLSARGRELILAGGTRVRAATPFEHPDGEWTLLSFSFPEARRDIRHQLRARLAWAGFGPLRDGLWLAPGTVEIGDLLSGIDGLAGADAALFTFAGRPMPGTDVGGIVTRAFDLPGIEQAHRAFQQRWSGTWSVPPDELAELVVLTADWLELLRTDPGVPAAHLPEGWPGSRSTEVYRRRHDAVHPPAVEKLQRMMGR